MKLFYGINSKDERLRKTQQHIEGVSHLKLQQPVLQNDKMGRKNRINIDYTWAG
jgi:hypothetical protein